MNLAGTADYRTLARARDGLIKMGCLRMIRRPTRDGVAGRYRLTARWCSQAHEIFSAPTHCDPYTGIASINSINKAVGRQISKRFDELAASRDGTGASPEGTGLHNVIGAHLARYMRGRNAGKSLGKATMLVYCHLDATTPKSRKTLQRATGLAASTVDRPRRKLAGQDMAKATRPPTGQRPRRRGRPEAWWIRGARSVAEVEEKMGARHVGDLKRAVTEWERQEHRRRLGARYLGSLAFASGDTRRVGQK